MGDEVLHKERALANAMRRAVQLFDLEQRDAFRLTVMIVRHRLDDLDVTHAGDALTKGTSRG